MRHSASTLPGASGGPSLSAGTAPLALARSSGHVCHDRARVRGVGCSKSLAAAVLGESRARAAGAVHLRGPRLAPAGSLPRPPPPAPGGSGGARAASGLRLRRASLCSLLKKRLSVRCVLGRAGAVYRKRKRRVNSGRRHHSGVSWRARTRFSVLGSGGDAGPAVREAAVTVGRAGMGVWARGRGGGMK